jgi:hypothetical protein
MLTWEDDPSNRPLAGPPVPLVRTKGTWQKRLTEKLQAWVSKHYRASFYSCHRAKFELVCDSGFEDVMDMICSTHSPWLSIKYCSIEVEAE